MSGLGASAKVIVETCMAAKPQDNIVVVVDEYARSRAIGQAVYEAARELGAKAVLMVMPPMEVMGQEPLRAVAAAMRGADIIFFAAEKYIPAHTNAWDEAVGAGIRIYATIGASEDHLKRPLSAAELYLMKERAEKVAQLWTDANAVRITSAAGTNLTLSLRGRKGTGLHPLRGVIVPDYSEAATAPVEGTTEGTIVVNGQVDGWGYVLDQPLRVAVARGRAVEVAGKGEDAQRLRTLLFSAENADNIGELAMGTSHLVPPRLSATRYDYAILGTVHIGFGRNTYLGGTTMSKVHQDVLMTGVTMEVDGRRVLEDGRLLI